MARRIKSYLSASNKGKAGHVFVNNLLVSSEKKRAEAKKQEQQNTRARAAISRKIAAEKEKAAKERERQHIKVQKFTVQSPKKQKAEKEKYIMFMARTRIECQKADIDSVCYELVVQEAIAAGVTVAQIGSVVIKGREQYWYDKSKELKELQYIQNVQKECKIRKKENNILDRFEDRLVTEVIESKLEIDSIRDSEIVVKYVQKTQEIILSVNLRLEAHLEKSIYE